MDFPNNETLSGKSARELLGELRGLYSGFIRERSEILSRQSASERIFGKMFASGSYREVGDLELRFFNSVDAICQALASQLEAGQDGDSPALALEACRYILTDHGEPGSKGLAMILDACDYNCRHLLPFLEKGDLEALKADFLKHIPKRDMFPRQRQLLKMMDR